MIYSKKQTGVLFLLIMFIIMAATYLVFFFKGNEFLSFQLTMTIIIACIIASLLFFRLKVTVSEKSLKLVYGIGLIRIIKTPDKLLKVEVIKKPWYYGILIRVTPEGMLYNIQGNKTVKITFTEDGTEKSVMIGSPEPEKLKKAIEDSFEM